MLIMYLYACVCACACVYACFYRIGYLLRSYNLSLFFIIDQLMYIPIFTCRHAHAKYVHDNSSLSNLLYLDDIYINIYIYISIIIYEMPSLLYYHHHYICIDYVIILIPPSSLY